MLKRARSIPPAKVLSESPIAAAAKDCVLCLDNGIFFEFIPVEELESDNPTRHWIKTVEAGQNYAIALTTNAGLWSYLLGDTVRFCRYENPACAGHGPYGLFPVGIWRASDRRGNRNQCRSRGKGSGCDDQRLFRRRFVSENPGEKGHHLFIVEFSPPLEQSQIDRFTTVLDEALSEANLDYREHRAGDVQMLPPLVQTSTARHFCGMDEIARQAGRAEQSPPRNYR